ncbi:hypothetical protein CA983_41225, partial [Streptomyces swartbergensis]
DPAREPAGSGRGLLETVGAEAGRAGGLNGTLGAKAGEPAESGRGLLETVSAGSGRVGGLAGIVGGLPASGGEPPEAVDASPVGGLGGAGSALPEPLGSPPGMGALPEAVGAAPVAVGALHKAHVLGVGAGDLRRAGPVPSADVPAVAVADEPEVDPDVTYESGEPSVSSEERPLSYAAFYGIPYVAMPTVARHRRRIRS